MMSFIIDTGASITVTPCLTDFIGTVKPVQAVEMFIGPRHRYRIILFL